MHYFFLMGRLNILKPFGTIYVQKRIAKAPLKLLLALFVFDTLTQQKKTWHCEREKTGCYSWNFSPFTRRILVSVNFCSLSPFSKPNIIQGKYGINYVNVCLGLKIYLSTTKLHSFGELSPTKTFCLPDVVWKWHSARIYLALHEYLSVA